MLLRWASAEATPAVMLLLLLLLLRATSGPPDAGFGGGSDADAVEFIQHVRCPEMSVTTLPSTSLNSLVGDKSGQRIASGFTCSLTS